MKTQQTSEPGATLQPPVISVVVPSLNAEGTLDQQLAALAAQEISERWELIVVDNGSTDRTAEIASRSISHHRCITRVVSEPRRGLNVARNAGVAAALSEKIAICDADDAVDPAWLRAMADGLDSADLVGGSMRTARINPRYVLDLRGLSETDDPRTSIGTGLGYLPQIIGANFGFVRRVWEQIGGFDERYQRGGDDVDFAWRAQLSGATLAYRPDAIVDYRLRPDKVATFKQYVRDGEGAVHLYAAHRSRGMPGTTVLEALRTYTWVVRRLHRLGWGSTTEQGQMIRVIGRQWGKIKGSVRHRVLYP